MCVCVRSGVASDVCCACTHVYPVDKKRQCRVVHLHSGVLSAIQAAKVMIVFSAR